MRSDGTRFARDPVVFMRSHFPTEFAKTLADAVGLVEWDYYIENGEYWKKCKSTKDTDHIDAMDFEKSYDALRDFQKLAMACPFEKCLVTWYGFELTDEQKDVLRIIYESTSSFLLGHAIDRAVERMDNDRTSNKDFGNMLAVILSTLATVAQEGGGNVPKEQLKSLTLKIENMAGVTTNV